MSANMTHVPNDITYFCNKCNMNEIYKHMYIMYMYIFIYIMKDIVRQRA